MGKYKKKTSRREEIRAVVSYLPVSDASVDIDMYDTSIEKRKKQVTPPQRCEKLFVGAMKTLSSSNSFEYDFERAKLYALNFGLSEEELQNPSYKESFVLAYLRGFKAYTQRQDIVFHFPFSPEQLPQRYPELLADAGNDNENGQVREKLLRWLNWIVLAQHALSRAKGNKCLLLRVLGQVIESDKLPSSSSRKVQHKGASASSSYHAKARSAMYDSEADTHLTISYNGKEVFSAVTAPDMKSLSPPSASTTKRKRALPAPSPEDFYTPQVQQSNQRANRGMKRPVKRPDLFVPGDDAAESSHVSFDLDLLPMSFSDLPSDEEMSPQKKKRKRAKKSPAVARHFSETGVGMGGRVSPQREYTTPTLPSYADMLPICTDDSALLKFAPSSSHALPSGKLGGLSWEEEEFELNSNPIPMHSDAYRSIYCPKPVALSRDRSFDLASSLLISSQPDFSESSAPQERPSRPGLPGLPLPRSAHELHKNRNKCVDACTSTEGSGGVDKPFVSYMGYEFTHPELIHELSILSWLSSQVENDSFQIGVVLPSCLPKSEDSAFFPKQAQTNKSTADFLTTTVLLDPGSPMGVLPPPRLQHASSAFSTPVSPQVPSSHLFRGPSTPMSMPSAPRKAELSRGYSWGCLGESAGGTPPSQQSFQQMLAGYAPGSSSSSKSYVQNFGAAGIFAGTPSGGSRGVNEGR